MDEDLTEVEEILLQSTEKIVNAVDKLEQIPVEDQNDLRTLISSLLANYQEYDNGFLDEAAVDSSIQLVEKFGDFLILVFMVGYNEGVKRSLEEY